MSTGSPSDPPFTPAGIDDHQLGLRLGALIAEQAASNLPFSAIFSQVQDLLGADTSLLGPLRDLLARPAFRQLVGPGQQSVLVGSRDALLQDLALTYNPTMVGRLATVIDGCMGRPPEARPAAAQPAQPQRPSQPELRAQPQPQPAPASPRYQPPAAVPNPVTGQLIALVSLLSGAVLVGLGWLLASSRPPVSSGSAPTASAPRAASPAPRPAAPASAPVAAATPKGPTITPPPPSGAWGGADAYKFGQLPGDDYPNSCAFSRTDASGRTTTDKSQLEFWACRDVGGDPENGYKVVWADGKETTYTFRPGGEGMVVGTNGTTYPMSWRNDSHQGDPVIVINHQDGATTWIPGSID